MNHSIWRVPLVPLPQQPWRFQGGNFTGTRAAARAPRGRSTTTMDKPMRPLRDIHTSEHFTFSSSLHGAAEPHSLPAFFGAMAHLARLAKANDLELLTAAIKWSGGTIVALAIQQLAAAALKATEEQVIALIEAGWPSAKKLCLRPRSRSTSGTAEGGDE
jgi:hypothetical protein